MKRSSSSSLRSLSTFRFPSGYARQENPKKIIIVLETCTVKVEESSKEREGSVVTGRKREVIEKELPDAALLYKSAGFLAMNNGVSLFKTDVTVRHVTVENKNRCLVASATHSWFPSSPLL